MSLTRLNQSFCFALVWVASCLQPSFAYSSEVPSTFTVDGRLQTSGNAALIDPSVTLILTVLDQGKTCVLYEESQTISTVPTDGYFSVEVGSAPGAGKRTTADSGLTMTQVFQNKDNVTGKLASDGVTACNVTATSGHTRYLRTVVQASTISAGAPKTLSPDLNVGSVPTAILATRAESVQGYTSDQLLKVNTSGSNALTQANLESVFSTGAKATALSAIADGTSTLYVSNSATVGARLPQVSGTPASAATGSIWYDTADNQIKFRNASGTTVSLASGSTGGVWTESSGNVYRSTGNVGIGTATPTSPLTVGSSSAGNGSALLNLINTNFTIAGASNSDGSGNANGLFAITTPTYASDGGVSLTGYSNLTRSGTYPISLIGNMAAVNTAGNPAVFVGGNKLNPGNSNLGLPLEGADIVLGVGTGAPSGGAAASVNTVFTADGRVGIGTTTPVAPLDVAGAIKVGASSATCSATNRGSIRYNTTTNVLEFCNGTGWNLVQAAACSDPVPSAVVFSNEANAVISTQTASNIVQVTGINCSVPVQISGQGSPQFRICSDASCVTEVQGWTASPSTVVNNQYLQVRLTSDTVGGSPYQATLIVGSGATVWTVTTAGGDCVGTTPAVGTVCADGTIYAGLSPDGNVKMFTTRCDVGQTWDGVACVGARLGLHWNNGSTNHTSTGFTSNASGKTNSAGLAALMDSGSPYHAAQNCENLNINGSTDWYLPALQELNVLFSNRTVIRNFETGGSTYWSSTESVNNAHAWNQRFSDGFQYEVWGVGKSAANLVRCVRR